MWRGLDGDARDDAAAPSSRSAPQQRFRIGRSSGLRAEPDPATATGDPKSGAMPCAGFYPARGACLWRRDGRIAARARVVARSPIRRGFSRRSACRSICAVWRLTMCARLRRIRRKEVLIVEGAIANLRDRANETPNMRIALRGQDKRELYVWTAPAPKAPARAPMNRSRFAAAGGAARAASATCWSGSPLRGQGSPRERGIMSGARQVKVLFDEHAIAERNRRWRSRSPPLSPSICWSWRCSRAPSYSPPT